MAEVLRYVIGRGLTGEEVGDFEVGNRGRADCFRYC